MEAYLQPPSDWIESLASIVHGWRVTLAIKFGRSSYQVILDGRVSRQDVMVADPGEEIEQAEPSQSSFYVDGIDSDGSALDLARKIFGLAAQTILDHRGRDGMPPRSGQVQLTTYDARDRQQTQIARTHRREEFTDDFDLAADEKPGDDDEGSDRRERMDAMKIIHATNKLLADQTNRTMQQNLALVGVSLRAEVQQRESVTSFMKGAMELIQGAATMQVGAAMELAEAEKAKAEGAFWYSPVGEAVGGQIGEAISVGLELLKLILAGKKAGA